MVKALPFLNYTHVKAEERVPGKEVENRIASARVMGNEIEHCGYLNVNITGSKHESCKKKTST